MDRRNFLRTASSFALLAAGATTGVSRVFAKTPSFSLTGNQSDENTPNMGDTMEYRKLGGLDVSAIGLGCLSSTEKYKSLCYSNNIRWGRWLESNIKKHFFNPFKQLFHRQ